MTVDHRLKAVNGSLSVGRPRRLDGRFDPSIGAQGIVFRVMAEAGRVGICIGARIFDRVTKGEEGFVCRLGQPRGMAWRGHNGQASKLPTDLRVMPVDPYANTRQAVLLDEP